MVNNMDELLNGEESVREHQKEEEGDEQVVERLTKATSCLGNAKLRHGGDTALKTGKYSSTFGFAVQVHWLS